MSDESELVNKHSFFSIKIQETSVEKYFWKNSKRLLF